MEFLKASDLKKIFVKWSQGTLYNRLDSLNIKDNDQYIIKSDLNGSVLYNEKAVEVLKNQYLKEFTNNSKEEIDAIDRTIADYLSNKSNAERLKQKEVKDIKKDDTIETFDKVEKNENVNSVNIRYINENYIFKKIHEDKVKDLEKQITTLEKQLDNLQKQLELETSNHKNLLDTIKLREQKEVFIEQQNLVKLQNQQEEQKIKLLESAEQKEERKNKGFFKRLFSFNKKENLKEDN